MVGRAIPFLVIHRRGKCTATSTIVVAHITVCSTKSQYLRQTWLMFNKKKAEQRQERFCVREIVFWWLTITRKGSWWQCHLGTIENWYILLVQKQIHFKLVVVYSNRFFQPYSLRFAFSFRKWCTFFLKTTLEMKVECKLDRKCANCFCFLLFVKEPWVLTTQDLACNWTYQLLSISLPPYNIFFSIWSDF